MPEKSELDPPLASGPFCLFSFIPKPLTICPVDEQTAFRIASSSVIAGSIAPNRLFYGPSFSHALAPPAVKKRRGWEIK
jgi:hypothetical protein